MLNNIWAQKSSVFFWYLTKAQSDGSCPITKLQNPSFFAPLYFPFSDTFDFMFIPKNRRQADNLHPQCEHTCQFGTTDANHRLDSYPPWLTSIHGVFSSSLTRSRAWATSNTSCATGPRSNMLKEARRSWRSVYHQYDYNLYDLGPAWVAGRLCRLLCTCTFPNI